MDADLARMWTTDRERYVLLRIAGEGNVVSYLPYDLATRTAVLIEDPEVEADAVRNMLVAGVRVTDQVPEHE